MEDDAMKALAIQAIELREWLHTQGVAERVTPNPFLGQWVMEKGQGMMEFQENTFTWYRVSDGSSDDAYSGDYSIFPGVRTHAGFILDRGAPMTSCFTLMQHYTQDRKGGVEMDADRYGAFTIEQLGTTDDIGVYNHRTGGRLVGHRKLSD